MISTIKVLVIFIIRYASCHSLKIINYHKLKQRYRQVIELVLSQGD